MKPSEILKKGLAYLGKHGENWSGGSCKKPAKPCMTTVLAEVTNCDEWPALEFMIPLFYPPKLASIWNWNDDPSRTFPEVKAKFLEAIALAEADERQSALDSMAQDADEQGVYDKVILP